MPMDKLQRVIQRLYEAAKGQAAWASEAFKGISYFVRSRKAILWTSIGYRLPVFRILDVDSLFVSEYQREWAVQDPIVQYLLKNPHQRIVHADLIITDAEKGRHPYYSWRDDKIPRQRRWGVVNKGRH